MSADRERRDMLGRWFAGPSAAAAWLASDGEAGEEAPRARSRWGCWSCWPSSATPPATTTSRWSTGWRPSSTTPPAAHDAAHRRPRASSIVDIDEESLGKGRGTLALAARQARRCCSTACSTSTRSRSSASTWCSPSATRAPGCPSCKSLPARSWRGFRLPGRLKAIEPKLRVRPHLRRQHARTRRSCSATTSANGADAPQRGAAAACAAKGVFSDAATSR